MPSNAFLPQHFHLTAALLSSMLQLFFFLLDTHCQVGEGFVLFVFFFSSFLSNLSAGRKDFICCSGKNKGKRARREGDALGLLVRSPLCVGTRGMLVAGAGPAPSRASFWEVGMLVGTVLLLGVPAHPGCLRRAGKTLHGVALTHASATR